MTRRRLKLKPSPVAEAKLRASPSDIGRTVQVRARNGSERGWWVTVYDTAGDGLVIAVGVAQEPKDWAQPVPAKRQNRGFGRRRWVLTAEVVTWKRKAP